MSGWAVTEWAVAITAILTCGGLVWTKVVKPLRHAWQTFKAWMDRVESSVKWTEEQMKPNGGSTLVDKVDMLLRHDAERDVDGKRYGTSEDA